LVVATDDDERQKIMQIYALGLANDVEGLSLIEGAEARRLEPELNCVLALISNETGIIDAHQYMLSLQGEIEDRGGAIALNTPIWRIDWADGGWRVWSGDATTDAIYVDFVVNAAGLGAQTVATGIESMPRDLIPPLILAKGNYFTYAGAPAFSRLVYPAPVDGGLGIHVTLDLAGRMRFGPDVEWISSLDYEVDHSRAAAFVNRIRRYWPRVSPDKLSPDYAGIRPKISRKNSPAADFLIQGPMDHGLPRLVNLFGIESPGLTASLSLGDKIADDLTMFD
jgi:L-2-hydroxyglutarate oxidase LhgO